MLIQFSVENFASFKEKAVLSLEPSKDSEHPENKNSIGDYQSLNTIAIYGANASGKTSLFKAFLTAIYIIKASNSSQVNQALPLIPFKFDEKCVREPSSFEFIFVAEDGKRYVYGFSADSQRIYEEYLYMYKTRRPTMIFEREKGNRYEFTQYKELEPLTQWNTENKLFLATATMWNAQITKIPFQWLAECVDGFNFSEYCS